jgi:putative transposase
VEKRQEYLESMRDSGRIVDIIAYSLMPNHFHLLLKQNKEKGVATYVANFVNAYTKYFNTKHERSGPLFQGVFKAVYVETDEQLVHLTRYIHLNPVASSLIAQEHLPTYQWSSYPAYLATTENDLVAKAQ